MFRSLDVYLGVPTEMAAYPGSGHGPVKKSQRLAKINLDLAWFEKWRWARPPPRRLR